MVSSNANRARTTACSVRESFENVATTSRISSSSTSSGTDHQHSSVQSPVPISGRLDRQARIHSKVIARKTVRVPFVLAYDVGNGGDDEDFRNPNSGAAFGVAGGR